MGSDNTDKKHTKKAKNTTVTDFSANFGFMLLTVDVLTDENTVVEGLVGTFVGTLVCLLIMMKTMLGCKDEKASKKSSTSNASLEPISKTAEQSSRHLGNSKTVRSDSADERQSTAKIARRF
jgi:hypothetical protein